MTDFNPEKPEAIVQTLLEAYTEIKNIKDTLYTNGAVYASMSGSGSTVYGIFEKNTALPHFSGTNYFVKTI